MFTKLTFTKSRWCCTFMHRSNSTCTFIENLSGLIILLPSMFLNISKWSKIRWKIRQYIESSKVKVLQGWMVKSIATIKKISSSWSKNYIFSMTDLIWRFFQHSNMFYEMGKKRISEFSSNYNKQLVWFFNPFNLTNFPSHHSKILKKRSLEFSSNELKTIIL